MEVHFKVYVGVSKPEVRRFTVERSVVTSYEYLVAKIENFFPALRNKTYNITWKDEEGDNILISSDDELLIALQPFLETGRITEVIKLYVEVEEASNKSDRTVEFDLSFEPTWVEPGAEAVHLHSGVVCDGCEGLVAGFRYRCTACRDFDLCAQCEAAGKHPEHCMLRIPGPVTSARDIRSKIKRSRQSTRNLFSEEHSTDKKSVFDVGYDSMYLKKPKCDKKDRRRHHADRHPRGSWIETVASYMNEFANLAGDVATATAAPPPQPAPSTSAAATAEPATNAENGEVIPPAQPNVPSTPLSHPKETDEVHIFPQMQYDAINEHYREIQKNLYKMVAQFMPRVDTQQQVVQTESSAQATASVIPNSTQTINPTVSPNATQTVSPGCSQEASCTPSMLSEAMDAVPVRQPSIDKADGWTMINNDNDIMDLPVPQTSAAASKPTAPTSDAASQPIGFKDLPKDFNNLQINDGVRVYPTLPTQSPYGEGNPASAAIPLPPPKQNAEQPAPPPRPRHPNPDVDAAIHQMLAMGFTDEGGWLTQLLESKDGNISAVLDLLTPVKAQNP